MSEPLAEGIIDVGHDDAHVYIGIGVSEDEETGEFEGGAWAALDPDAGMEFAKQVWITSAHLKDQISAQIDAEAFEEFGIAPTPIPKLPMDREIPALPFLYRLAAAWDVLNGR
jgi:hypothetical protein